eukprot:CAMPEP_0175154420 /NCGR_PEP_ID=MMETSP0087-20121206/20327_1 /TAXON_ID=136419 /ORGANISM="Unknown Unknown, Strain D1" /LENGTH=99 /DNA_ID=CAMNT_0016441297 /DNA_START=360 /DNA_END=659 /DNA_ORIENTATION=-
MTPSFPKNLEQHIRATIDNETVLLKRGYTIDDASNFDDLIHLVKVTVDVVAKGRNQPEGGLGGQLLSFFNSNNTTFVRIADFATNSLSVFILSDMVTNV